VEQTVLGIILGGGAGSRLYPLTKNRAKPAVPLGANYRLIDIPVSNCVNSNVTKIYTLTQFNSASLNRHLSQAYVSCPAGGGERVVPRRTAGRCLLRGARAPGGHCSSGGWN
jgi:glucose-1-phosphate adenylyltransferase